MSSDPARAADPGITAYRLVYVVLTSVVPKILDTAATEFNAGATVAGLATQIASREVARVRRGWRGAFAVQAQQGERGRGPLVQGSSRDEDRGGDEGGA